MRSNRKEIDKKIKVNVVQYEPNPVSFQFPVKRAGFHAHLFWFYFPQCVYIFGVSITGKEEEEEEGRGGRLRRDKCMQMF